MQPLHPADPAWVAGYRTLGRLGAGGMGMVLLGRSPGGSLVAIKLIRAEYADDPGFRARFRREVAIARRVRNRWAVPVTDADTEAAAPWLATEFVPGPALNEAVGGLGPLPEPSVRALGVMLAEALDAVHAAGLVHRDVKPGNVLLALDGPRLIDFGIARALDDTVLTATDVVIGSPGFLSPEQAQGRPVGPASDLFSLGCVLAYAATGQRPFGSGPAEAMLFRTVHDPADISSVPDGIRALIEALLAKDPQDRPAAALLRREWAADRVPGEGWLPGPVTHLIAERSARMLALPQADPTEVVGGGSGAGTRGGTGPRDAGPVHAGPDAPTQGPGSGPPPADARPAPSRRRLLAYTGAVTGVLAAGGGTALWLNSRDPEGGNKPGGPTGEGPNTTRTLLKLGFHADLSGELATIAEAQRQGAELAVEELNNDTSHPFQYQLVTVDDEGDPQLAKEAAAELAGDSTVVAVLSATGPEATKTSVTSYDEDRLPVITVTDGAAISVASAWVSARTNDLYLLPPVVTYLTSDEQRTTALIDDGSQASWEITRNLNNTLRAGGQTVLTKKLGPDTADFATPVRELVSQQPDAVVYGGGWRALVPVAGALADAGYQGPRLATNAAFDRRFPEKAGAAAEGWLLATAVTDPAATDTARDFTTAFRRRHGEAPGPYAVEAYDAIGVLATCVQELRRDRKLAEITRQEVVKVLRQTEHEGAAKTYSFEEVNGTFTGEGTFFYEVTDHNFHFLGDQLPPWDT
jgi:ABC-type branched-subunit amino acid transport system substrate-binding protein/tRNA A-37 threonylcarbamoyl transferase component Bud32